MQTILAIGQCLYDLGGFPLVQLAIVSPVLLACGAIWLMGRYQR